MCPCLVCIISQLLHCYSSPPIRIYFGIDLTLYDDLSVHLVMFVIALDFIAMYFSNWVTVASLFPCPHLDRIKMHCLVVTKFVGCVILKHLLLPLFFFFVVFLLFFLLHTSSFLNSHSSIIISRHVSTINASQMSSL